MFNVKSFIFCICLISIAVIINFPQNVSAQEQDTTTIKDLNVDPSAGNRFTISFVLTAPGKVTSKIFKATGEIVRSFERVLPADTIKFNWLPDSSFNPDVYYLWVKSDSQQLHRILTFLDTNDSCQGPAGAFSYYRGYKKVQFYNTSSKADDYIWDFGNDFQDTAYQPVHQIDSTGMYKVCLQTQNPCGKDTFCRKVNITCKTPEPDFTYDVRDQHVNFFNHSKYATQYQWHFGDGDSALVKGPGHQYSKDSVYKVCLEAYNKCEMSDTCKTIAISKGSTRIKTNAIQNIQIFPNPLHKGQNLRIEGLNAKNIRVQLYNASGQVVKHEAISSALKLKNLNPGFYHYQLWNDQKCLKRGKLVLLH